MRDAASSNVTPPAGLSGPRATAPLRSRRQALAGLLGGALAAGGLSVGCELTPAPPLRVGLSLFPAYELVFLAQELGYFREARVAVRLLEFAELADVRRAYEQGKLDGLQATLVEVLVVRNAGVRDLQIVRALDASDGADQLVAAATVRSVAELAGASVGVEAESVGELLLARALERHGVPFESVTRVPMRQHQMASALGSGRVRAVATYPPFSKSLLADPGYHTLFSSSEIPGEILDVHAFDRSVVDERPEDVRAFLAAVARARTYHTLHPEEACRLMAPRESVSAAELCESLATGMVLLPSPEAPAPTTPRVSEAEALTRTISALRKTGMLSDRPGLADCLRLL